MIKNLLFDLGGVIMNLKRHDCIASYRRLGMAHPEELLDEYTQRGPFLMIEDGSLTVEGFREEIRKYIPNEVSDKEIDDAFSDFLAGIPTYRLHALENLHHHFKIYMLSNTNPIMWNGRIAEEFKKDGHDVEYYFDGIVTSFEAGAVKPDRRIFELVKKKFDIKPEETLFFDDSERNIKAAEALGFKTKLVLPETEFTDCESIREYSYS